MRDAIAEVCAARAQSLGLSAYRVAQIAGLNKEIVARFLRGRNRMRSDHIAKLLVALDLAILPRR